MDNFLIIRLSSLGDIIHTLPAFSVLRRNLPGAKISWAVERKGKEILDFVPGIDEIISVSSRGWRKKLWNRNQTAIDFQGLVKSGFIAVLSGARKRIGFSGKNLKEPLAAMFYTDRLEEISESQHVISKNLRLLSKVGIHEDLHEFPIEIPAETKNSVREKLALLGCPKDKKLVLFNVGAAWETKRWFPENWIKVLKSLKLDNIFPLLLWGNEEEKKLAETISQQTRLPAAPFFSLKEILALIKEARLLVSGDTFALQVACAFSVPVVGLFGPTNPQRNGPFSAGDRVSFHKLDCSYCYKRTCRSLKCLKRITPEEITHLVLQLLKKNG